MEPTDISKHKELSKLCDKLLAERRFFEENAALYQELFLDLHDELVRTKSDLQALRKAYTEKQIAPSHN